MPIDLENTTPIDPQDHQALLQDLQGNILKGHGRESVVLLSLRFTGEVAKARQWVGLFGAWVTPASRQDQQVSGWENDEDGSIFINFFLTCAGYRYLGVEDARIPQDPRFRAGMLGSRERLNDPPGTAWQPPYDPARQPIHAMALLASSSPSAMQAKADQVIKSLRPIADVGPVQKGQMIRAKVAQERPKSQRYIEHLNHVDGRSQPLFFRQDVQDEIDGDGIDAYDPSAPLSLVLVKEPRRAGERPDGHGSYLVYRKLEQNVRGFKERERKPGDAASPSVADRLGLVGDDRRRVGAMVVGRFENGTPIAIAPRDSLDSAPNNFHYGDDPAGTRCPLFAHIRKVNERTPASRRHRIVRRGVTYDDLEGGRETSPLDPAQTYAQMPTGGVGLLFMCFQSSIADQFEHLQIAANSPDVPVRGAGIDPLAGQAGEADDPTCRWPRQWGGDETTALPFGSFVRLKAGEYFFAPSLSFLKGLGEPLPRG